MTHKTQKIISAALIAFVVIAGFEVLIYILNLNQPVIYFQVAFWISLYLFFKILFLFDLHFKERGSWQRAKNKHGIVQSRLGRFGYMVFSAFWDRFKHMRKLEYLNQCAHFLLLPAFIYWSTISLFYVNFGFIKVQQTVAMLSAAALILCYWYMKEIFYRKRELVDSNIFLALKIVKIYAALIVFGASLAVLRYYCLPALYFSTEVFCYAFLLVYLAIYQLRRVNGQTIAIALIISILMGALGQLVYIYWGYNYYTAAVFLTASYNLFWSLFHYRLDNVLNRRAFMEILLTTILIMALVFSVTNFRAKILNGCEYSTGQI